MVASKFDVTETPLQLQDYRGVGVFAGQKRSQNRVFFFFLHYIDLMHVAERQDYHLIDDLWFSYKILKIISIFPVFFNVQWLR